MTRLEQIAKRLRDARTYPWHVSPLVHHAPDDVAYLLDVAIAAREHLRVDGGEGSERYDAHAYVTVRDRLRAILAQEDPIDRVLQEGEEREA